MTDPISDMLTRLRNANLALVPEVEVAHSKLKESIATILKQEGYLADCSVEDITAEILSEAALPDIGPAGADLQASQFDHIRDLRKHERA